jgi:hypothetical protein
MASQVPVSCVQSSFDRAGFLRSVLVGCVRRGEVSHVPLSFVTAWCVPAGQVRCGSSAWGGVRFCMAGQGLAGEAGLVPVC